MTDLLVLMTSLVDFLGVAVTLWLGFYVLTRSPRRTTSWLAALTLWSLSGLFVRDLLVVNTEPGASLPWWAGWSVLFAASLWLHLSVALRPGGGGLRWAVAVAAAYALGATLLGLEISTDWILGAASGQAVTLCSRQEPGPLFSVLVVYLLACPLLALRNLEAGEQRARTDALRHQFVLLYWATLLVTAGTAIEGLAIWMHLALPMAVPSALLLGGVVMLGYAVIRTNALLEGRIPGPDLALSLLSTVAVIAIYLPALTFSYTLRETPLLPVLLVLALAIATHTLYDGLRAALDRLLYRKRDRELRASLRALAQEAWRAEDPGARLTPLLHTLCEALGVEKSLIAARDDDQACVLVRYPAGLAGEALPPNVLEIAEATPLDDAGIEGALRDMSLLVPLVRAGETIGVLAVGRRAQGGEFDDHELDLLDDLADRLAGALLAARQREASARQLEALAHEFRQREQALRREVQIAFQADFKEVSREEVAPHRVEWVEDALRHLHDFSHLGISPLTQWRVVTLRLGEDDVTHLDRGRALQAALLEALEKLRPPGERSRELTPAWRQYVVLHSAYVEGEPNREIMARLYIGEGTFNRARRRALQAVTRALEEMEAAAHCAEES